MKQPVSQSTAEARVMRKYSKLYVVLIELVDALQNMEPGGTLVDEATFTKKKDGGMRIAYKARPVQLVINDGQRKFSLRVDEVN